jgi:hypothetical protein
MWTVVLHYEILQYKYKTIKKLHIHTHQQLYSHIAAVISLLTPCIFILLQCGIHLVRFVTLRLTKEETRERMEAK